MRQTLVLSDLRLPATKSMWAKLVGQSDKDGWPAARFLAALAAQEKGPVWLVQPVTPKGEAWMIDHTSVRALRLFGAIEVERGSAQNIFNGARADGLDVGIDMA